MMPVKRSKVDAMQRSSQGKSYHSVLYFVMLIVFSGKQATTTDDDSNINVVAYKDAQRAFKSPPSIGGIQCTLNHLAHWLEMSAHEWVAILKEHQAIQEYMAHLIKFQQDLWDQVATQGKQGEVEDLVAGSSEQDEGDRDDGDDEEDELDHPEFVQGSSCQ
jgi:hypothetical protein